MVEGNFEQKHTFFMIVESSRKSLEQVLLSEGFLEEKELQEALAERDKSGKPLEEILVEMDFLSPSALIRAKSLQFGIPYLDLTQYKMLSPVKLPLSLKFMKQYKFFPLEVVGDSLKVVMADPFDYSTLEAIRFSSKYDPEVYICDEEAILSALERCYGDNASRVGKIIEGIGEVEEGTVSGGEDDTDIDHLKDLAREAPIVRLVNLLIDQAIESRASDIHIESFERTLRVRYRIDGLLYDRENIPKRHKAAVISRIKILANMKIDEKRLPQDGRIKYNYMGRTIDLRVSTLPTLYGESVVIRILDRESIRLDLEQLGFSPKSLLTFKSLIEKPYGMLLVTGPTGSGKTTTLYAALSQINSRDRKIITIEDPIEYQLEGVNQMQVNPKIDLTFANGLRSIVRQDPDVIMVGEIRDRETAEIAIHAALTGHLVFSTLHTNDAPGAITRLLDMDIEGFLIASSVIGVLAQRLVRVNCENCKQVYLPTEEVLKKMELTRGKTTGYVTYRGKGCEECGFTGYKGRIGIFELMVIEESIRELIVKKAPSAVIKEKARALGLVPLREDGWEKVKQGVTSIEEVLRVTQEDI
jgi:general secretion pathway protein E